MGAFNSAVTRAFDIFFAPFMGLSPWAGLAAISLVTGVAMLLVFKATSNQQALRQAKDRVIGHLLEIRLYQHDLAGVLRAQGRALLGTARYLRYAAAPIVWVIIPVVIILAQTDLRYGRRPLRPGESAIVAVTFETPPPQGSTEARLTVPAGLTVESEPLRILTRREVDWRIRAQRPGTHEVKVSWPGESVTKQVVVARGRERVSARRAPASLAGVLLHPGEAPLPAEAAGVREITCSYPAASVPLLGWRVHWLVVFFALSLGAAYALKGVFRVEV